MDMLSFATGLAIGKKKYGGGGNSIFQDILRYSTQVNTIPIDSTYKWTLNFWYTDRLEFNGNCFDSNPYVRVDKAGGEDDAMSIIFPIYKYVQVCKIAWENNVPLFAICCRGGLCTSDIYTSSPVGIDNNNYKQYFYKNTEYVVEPNSYSSYGGISLVVSATQYNANMYYSYGSQATAVLTRNNYGITKETISDVPVVHLNNSTTELKTISTNTSLFPTSDSNTFSDMSTAEVYEKWQKMYVAALIANDINAREAIIVQPT